MIKIVKIGIIILVRKSMLKIKSKIKFNNLLENIVKCFIILLFAATVFDKANITYLKDIIVKLDLESVQSHIIQILLTIKTFSFDLPILFSIFVVVFNIICFTSFIIILLLLLLKSIFYVSSVVQGDNITHERKHYELVLSNTYLINEKFRC